MLILCDGDRFAICIEKIRAYHIGTVECPVFFSSNLAACDVQSGWAFFALLDIEGNPVTLI